MTKTYFLSKYLIHPNLNENIFVKNQVCLVKLNSDRLLFETGTDLTQVGPKPIFDHLYFFQSKFSWSSKFKTKQKRQTLA